MNRILRGYVSVLLIIIMLLVIVVQATADFIEPQQIELLSTDITASFTDAGFRAAVREKLGKLPTEPIFDTDVNDKAVLDLAYNKPAGTTHLIRNLNGIEHFVLLESLWFEDHEVTIANFTSNPQLRYIYAANNLLTSINVSNNAFLNYLDVHGNRLTTINVSNNPQLDTLFAYDNRLTTIDVSNNILLKRLVASNNQLTTINVSNNPSLERLDVHRNQITAINVSNNAMLNYLSVSDNQLTTINVSNNPLLVSLFVKDNLLTAIDVSGKPLLNSFDCSFNSMNSLSRVTGWNSSPLLTLGTSFIYSPQPPNAPQNFRATQGASRITLNWTAPVANCGTISFYQVSSDNGVNWRTASSSTSHTFTGLAAETTYTFRVRAVAQAIDNGVTRAVNGVTASVTETAYDAVNQFVSRLYLDVLKRPFDAGGLQFWSNWLRSGEMTGAAAAYEFVFSNEFINRNLNDADYVETLYVAFMGRVSDPGGKAYWVDLLEAGLPREDVFAGFANSTEFEYLCSVAGIRRGMHVPPAGGYAQVFIKRMYLTTLERPADPDGVAFWQGLAVNGMTGAAMAYEFVFSGEMERRGLSDKEFIEILYNSMMGRPSEAGGMAFWLDLMEKQGVSRYTVFANFVMSGEFEMICNRHGLLRGTPP